MKTDKPKTIYAIFCRATKRTYIGCCTNFKDRMWQHFNELANDQKRVRVSRYERGKSQWQKDYDQYGREGFDVYVLEENVPAEWADKKELEYILKYRANELEYGYNLRPTKRPELVISCGAPPLPEVRSA